MPVPSYIPQPAEYQPRSSPTPGRKALPRKTPSPGPTYLTEVPSLSRQGSVSRSAAGSIVPSLNTAKANALSTRTIGNKAAETAALKAELGPRDRTTRPFVAEDHLFHRLRAQQLQRASLGVGAATICKLCQLLPQNTVQQAILDHVTEDAVGCART